MKAVEITWYFYPKHWTGDNGLLCSFKHSGSRNPMEWHGIENCVSNICPLHPFAHFAITCPSWRVRPANHCKFKTRERVKVQWSLEWYPLCETLQQHKRTTKWLFAMHTQDNNCVFIAQCIEHFAMSKESIPPKKNILVRLSGDSCLGHTTFCCCGSITTKSVKLRIPTSTENYDHLKTVYPNHDQFLPSALLSSCHKQAKSKTFKDPMDTLNCWAVAWLINNLTTYVAYRLVLHWNTFICERSFNNISTAQGGGGSFQR